MKKKRSSRTKNPMKFSTKRFMSPILWGLFIVLLILGLMPLLDNQVVDDKKTDPLLEIPSLKQINAERRSKSKNKEVTVLADQIIVENGTFKSQRLQSIPKEVLDQTKSLFKDLIETTLSDQTPKKLYILYQAEFGQSGLPDSGKILAAEIIHGKKSKHIVLHEKDTGESLYLSPNGRFLDPEFLKTPLKTFKRISSKFSTSRKHPILEEKRNHKGTDYAARLGTQVRAVADGRIATIGDAGSFGNLITIAHKDNMETRYGHLLKFAPNLRTGSYVTKGEVIGYVGMTGLATAPHLHFELLENGIQIDPRKLDEMASALGENEKADFLKTTNQYLNAIQEFKKLESY